MKIIFCFVFVCLTLLNRERIFAQNDNSRYNVAIYFGGCSNLFNRGPKTQTIISPVKFLNPITKSVGTSFGLKAYKNYSIGLELFYDEFDCGYKAENKYNTKGINIISGLEATSDRIILYKVGLKSEKKIIELNRMCLNASLIPSIAYSKKSSILEDTAENNKYFRNSNLEVLYLRYPSYQNPGLHFVLKATAELQYKFSNNMSLALDVAYQQGFRPFVIDTVNIIRQYEPNEPQHKYWTRFSGTSVQFHFGMKYDF